MTHLLIPPFSIPNYWTCRPGYPMRKGATGIWIHKGRYKTGDGSNKCRDCGHKWSGYWASVQK